MYVAMSAGADGEDAQRLSSYRGKILRFARDGRTATDNPRSSPVYSSGHRDPRGLAWHPGNAALWEAEPSPGGDEINIITAGGDYGWPLEARSRGRVSTLTASVTLPAGSSPAGLTIVNDSSSVLFGDAIVSAPGLSDLLRIRADGEGRPMAGPPARIVQGRFGEVGAVAALGGALYFVTANQRLWGAGRDLLVRLVPVAP
jgi:glucose/arabinose dehydrogenase